MLWVELWLHAARRPELRPTAARLYARMHAWFAEAIAEGVASGEFTVADPDRTVDRLLALIDGYGIRALTEDPAMPIERAREEIWAAIAPELGVRSLSQRLALGGRQRAARDLERRRGLDRRRRPSVATVSRVRKLARPTASSVQVTVTGSRPSGRR